MAFVGVDVLGDPQICTFGKCRKEDAAAEATRGLVTPCESDAQGGEGIEIEINLNRLA